MPMTRPSSRSTRDTSKKSGVERKSSASQRGSRRSSSRSSSRRKKEDNETSQGSRRNQQEEGATRSRRGSVKKADNRIMYGGVAGAALLILILIAASYVGGNGELSRRAGTVTTSPSVLNTPSETPYSSKREARKALAQAHKLFDEGAKISGSARNSSYMKTMHICKRIMATSSAGSMHQDAHMLYYSAFKCRTNE